MRFRYSAKTRDGSLTRKGEIDAPNKQSAVNLLREKKLVVYSMIPVSEKSVIPKLSSLFQFTGLGEKVRFTEQLASMISAGLPLTKALEVIVSQTKNARMAETVQEVLNDVEAGTALSKSFSNFPKIFDKSYVSLVRAGESSGKLDVVLRRLADTLEKEREFKSKVKGAMIYPAIILSAMAIVFALIMVLVVPKMATMYESLNVELPFATQALIAISTFLVDFWWLMILIIIAFVVGIKYFKQTTIGEYFFAKLALSVPIFGNLNKQAGLVEFTRTLGLLVESGVSIVDSLEIVRDTANNVIYRDSIDRFVEDVKHGLPLSQTIAKERYFPDLVSSMLVVGEETGTIDERLNNLSVYFEGEVDKIVKNLSTAMEPLIMIMLGIMVLLLILAVITPIYQLTAQF